MNRLFKFSLLAVAVMSVAATTIQWYSQQTPATLAQEQVIAVENPSPHAFQSTTIGDLRDWLIGSTVASDADLVSATNSIFQRSTNAAKTYTDVQVQAGTNSAKTYTDLQVSGITLATGTLTNNQSTPVTFSNSVTVYGEFNIYNTNPVTTVGTLVSTGSISGPISGTNIIIGTLNSNKFDPQTLNAFYPRNNPSNFIAIPLDENGHLFTVTNGTKAILAVTVTNVVADGSGITNIQGSGMVGYEAKQQEQDASIASLLSGSAGVSGVSNVYSVSWSSTLTNGEYAPVLTNNVITNNTWSGTVWVRGKGATNAYYGRLDGMYWKGLSPLWAYSSNVFLSTGTLGAYITTNVDGNIVYALKGAGDEPINWSIKALTENATNSFAGAAPAVVNTNYTLTNGLVAYWEMENGGWANSGPLNVPLTAVGTVSVVPGLTGNAAEFNGVNANYLYRLNETRWSALSDSVTFIAWFKLNSTNAASGFVSKWNTAQGQKEYQFVWSKIYNSVTFGLATNGVVLSTGAYSIVSTPARQWPTNEWFMAAAIVNPATLKTKVRVGDSSGSLEDWTESTQWQGWGYAGSGTNTVAPLRIGLSGQDLSTINGQLDNVGVWNRALTDEEIAEIYNAGAGVDYSTLQGL